MADLQQIKVYLDNYLALGDFTDDAWNGLQFEGRQVVNKIAAAVDASLASFQAAASVKADLLLVHHGLFWRHANPSPVSWQKDRLNLLFRHNLSLYAVHLPLDKHAVVGNNAQLLLMLNARLTDEFYPPEGRDIGWIGRIKPTPLSTIALTINHLLHTTCQVLPHGPKLIRTIAVCSGGGSYAGFFAALAKDVDLYLTGDPVYLDPGARDARINVIFAGHYATETLGVKALAAHIATKFNLRHDFLNLPPP